MVFNQNAFEPGSAPRVGEGVVGVEGVTAEPGSALKILSG